MAGVEALYGAYGVYALQGKGVGGDVGGHAVAFGDGDDALHGVVDAHDALGSPLLVVAFELVGDVYEASGVYDVVGRVEDAALGERLAVAGLEQDVVRAAGDDGAPEVRQRFVVDDGPEGAGGEYVAWDGEDLVRLYWLRPECLDHHLDRPRVHVAHYEFRSFAVVQ